MARIIVKLIHEKLQELNAADLPMIIVEHSFGFARLLADDLILLRKVQLD